MSTYIARSCPRCSDDFWVVVSQIPRSNGEYPINAHCALCGYSLDGWRLIVGQKRSDNAHLDRILKVVR